MHYLKILELLSVTDYAKFALSVILHKYQKKIAWKIVALTTGHGADCRRKERGKKMDEMKLSFEKEADHAE